MPPATGTDDKAPDTVRGDEEQEMSLEELTEKNLKDEGLRVYSNGEEAKEPVSYLLSIREEAIADGKKAKAALQRADVATGLVATSMLKIRLSLRNPKTGLPDWGGGSAVYKGIIQGIIDSVKTNEESRATAANRLQRRCTRMLGTFVAEYVNEEKNLGLDPEVIVSTVKTAEKEGYETATKSEDEDVQALVKAVNEQFRAGKHDENEPYSPFEPKKGAQRSAAATRAETLAADAVRNIAQFRQSLPHLQMDVSSEELVLIAQALSEQFHSKDPAPSFGKGRNIAATNWFAAGSILIELAIEASDQKPNKEQRESYEKAMALSF